MGGKEKLLTINNNWFLFLHFSFLRSLHQQPLSGHALQGADGQDVGAAGEGGDVHCGGHAVGGLLQHLAARVFNRELKGELKRELNRTNDLLLSNVLSIFTSL